MNNHGATETTTIWRIQAITNATSKQSFVFLNNFFLRIPKCQEPRVKRIETQSSNTMPVTDDFGGYGFGNEFPDPGKISTTTTRTTTYTQQIYVKPTEARYVRPVEVQTRGARPTASYRTQFFEAQTDNVDPPQVQYEATTAMERQNEITEPKLSVQRIMNLKTVPTTTRPSTENAAVEVLEDILEPNENEDSSQKNESDKQPQNRQGQLSVQVPKSVQSLTCK